MSHQDGSELSTEVSTTKKEKPTTFHRRRKVLTYDRKTSGPSEEQIKPKPFVIPERIICKLPSPFDELESGKRFPKSATGARSKRHLQSRHLSREIQANTRIDDSNRMAKHTLQATLNVLDQTEDCALHNVTAAFGRCEFNNDEKKQARLHNENNLEDNIQDDIQQEESPSKPDETSDNGTDVAKTPVNYMEFTLSKFPQTNRKKSDENAVCQQQETPQPNIPVILPRRRSSQPNKAITEHIMDNIVTARKGSDNGLSSLNQAEQDDQTGSNDTIPSVRNLDQIKSPKTRLLANMFEAKKVKSEDLGRIVPEKDVKKLEEENDNLRKANTEKEEIIEILLNALKQNSQSAAQPEKSASPIPEPNPYPTQKEMRKLNYNREKLASAEKSFTPGKFSQFSHQKPLVIPPVDKNFEEYFGFVRGKRQDYSNTLHPETQDTLKTPIVLTSHLQSDVNSQTKQSKHFFPDSDTLYAKRVYSSPMATQFESQLNASPVMLLNNQRGSTENRSVNDFLRPSEVISYSPEYQERPSAVQRGLHSKNAGSMIHLKSTLVNNAKYLMNKGPSLSVINDKIESKTMQNGGEYEPYRPKNKERPIKLSIADQRVSSTISRNSTLKLNVRDVPSWKSANQSEHNSMLHRVEEANDGPRVWNEEEYMRQTEGEHGSGKREDGYGEIKQEREVKRREKFPKEVFSMNIRKRFFC